MVKVSAIITTHNRLPLLKRAVLSVLNQTYANIELIVVDDHSTDGSVQWCAQNNITVLQNINRGGNFARNAGIRNATGDYVAFLDDDDYWFQDKITKQVALVEASGCGVAYCGIRKEKKTNGKIQHEYIFPKSINQGDVSKRILQEIFTVTSSLMVKRDLLIESGLFNEGLDFWQEYELCIRLAQKTNFMAVDDILVGYLIDNADKNRLTNKYDNWRNTVRTIRHMHKDLYSQLSPLEYVFAERVQIWDAIARCENAGLKNKLHLNILKLKLSFITEKILKFIGHKHCLNHT